MIKSVGGICIVQFLLCRLWCQIPIQIHFPPPGNLKSHRSVTVVGREKGRPLKGHTRKHRKSEFEPLMATFDHSDQPVFVFFSYYIHNDSKQFVCEYSRDIYYSYDNVKSYELTSYKIAVSCVRVTLALISICSTASVVMQP